MASLFLLLASLAARRDGREIEEENSVIASDTACASSGCHDMESDSTFNQQASIEVVGLPERYEPGERADVTLRILCECNARVWGAQVAALLADGTQAGVLVPTGGGLLDNLIDGIRVLVHSPIPLKQNEVSFLWVAPSQDRGDVTFRIGVNAGNDNDDPSLDHIARRDLTVLGPNSVPLVETFFAQVGDGVGGSIRFTTSIILINNGQQSTSARVDFLDTFGNPFEVRLGELGPASGFDIPLAAGGAFSGETAGVQDPLQAGYVRITAPESVGGTAVFRRSDADSGIVFFEAGVPSSRPILSFRLFVDRRGTRQTGVALVNPGDQPAKVMLTLTDLDGQPQPGSPQPLTLQSGQHKAQFVGELFPGLPPGFTTGVLSAVSDQPVAAVTLRQDDDTANMPFPASVPLLAAFPVVANDSN